jgi:hypothetical protein
MGVQGELEIGRVETPFPTFQLQAALWSLGFTLVHYSVWIWGNDSLLPSSLPLLM